jgi:hypothetical protein
MEVKRSSSRRNSQVASNTIEGSTLTDVNAFLLANVSPESQLANREVFMSLMHTFTKTNTDPATSPHLQTSGSDKLHHLSKLLFKQHIRTDDDVLVLVLKTLKIACRKPHNRAILGAEVLVELVEMLRACIGYHNASLVIELIFCLCNLCYEPANCVHVLAAQGLQPLITSLRDIRYGPRAQESAAGALHHLCFTLEGKRLFYELEGIPIVLELLQQTASATTQARCMGILHNLSTLSPCIRVIREQEGINTIVEFLACDDMALVTSAAGALQNMAREAQSRLALLETDSVALLSRLLFANDVECQCKAVSALLNILGPQTASNGDIAALETVLSDCIVVGALYSAMAANPEVNTTLLPVADMLPMSPYETMYKQHMLEFPYQPKKQQVMLTPSASVATLEDVHPIVLDIDDPLTVPPGQIALNATSD